MGEQKKVTGSVLFKDFIIYTLIRAGIIIVIAAIIFGIGLVIGIVVPVLVALLFSLIIAMPISFLLGDRYRGKFLKDLYALDTNRRELRNKLKQELDD